MSKRTKSFPVHNNELHAILRQLPIDRMIHISAKILNLINLCIQKFQFPHVLNLFNTNAFLTCPIQLREGTPNTLDSCMPMKNFSNCTHYCWNTKSFLSIFFPRSTRLCMCSPQICRSQTSFYWGGLDRLLPGSERLNVTSWSDVRGNSQKLSSQVCFQRLNFILNAWFHIHRNLWRHAFKTNVNINQSCFAAMPLTKKHYTSCIQWMTNHAGQREPHWKAFWSTVLAL